MVSIPTCGFDDIHRHYLSTGRLQQPGQELRSKRVTGDTEDRGDTVVEGTVVSGIVPNGLEGVVVQPGIITIKTSTSEIQKVVMNNVDLDILEHPVVVVDSF